MSAGSGIAMDSSQLPNPYTPMAFLSPDVAYEVTIASYVLVGSLSMLIWDIMTNLKTDYHMFSRGPIRLPLVTYVVCRVGTLASVLFNVIAATAPLGNCTHIWPFQFLYILAMPPTLLLFFFRIQGMYHDNTPIKALFFLLWLSVLAVDCVTPLLGRFANIGDTDYCQLIFSSSNGNKGSLMGIGDVPVPVSERPYVFVNCIVHLVNDGAVFIATSWKLMQMSHKERSVRNGVRTMLFGDYLPAFSRSMLKDGQLYLLTTVDLNFLTALLYFIPTIPVPYRSVTCEPCIVLMNSMACYVFRNIRPGVYRESVTLPTISVGLAFTRNEQMDTKTKSDKRGSESSFGSGTMTSRLQDDSDSQAGVISTKEEETESCFGAQEV